MARGKMKRVNSVAIGGRNGYTGIPPGNAFLKKQCEVWLMGLLTFGSVRYCFEVGWPFSRTGFVCLSVCFVWFVVLFCLFGWFCLFASFFVSFCCVVLLCHISYQQKSQSLMIDRTNHQQLRRTSHQKIREVSDLDRFFRVYPLVKVTSIELFPVACPVWMQVFHLVWSNCTENPLKR